MRAALPAAKALSEHWTDRVPALVADEVVGRTLVADLELAAHTQAERVEVVP